MRHRAGLVSSRAWLLVGIAGASMLAGCSKETQQPAAATVASSGTAEDREALLKQREEQLIQREAAVTEKEREQALAQREAEVAAQEQEIARQKQELEAAAAKKASATKSSAKIASSKSGSKSGGSSSTPTRVASAEPAAPPPPERIEVPSGTVMTLALTDELSSKTARPGDTLVTTVASNLTINGKTVVPIGTRVTGTITDVISGSRSIGAIPTIGIRFNQLELENGQTIPITGDLVEEGKSERGQDAAKILGGVAAGAVLGHQVKTNNRGKVIGGLLGGAIGAVAAKKTGSEVTMAAGSTVTISTGEPFTVEVPAR